MTHKNNILIAVSGGIAVYKIPTLVSLLVKDQYNVFNVMSKAAQKFVTPLTFASISGNSVQTDIFTELTDNKPTTLYPHLYPAHDADIFLLAPATAESIAKIAQGHGSDIISASALALKPNTIKIFCPAMNKNMWLNPMVQKNVKVLLENGWLQIGPEEGKQACGDIGPGRLSEPEKIYEFITDALKKKSELNNKRILIVSGPTREYIDPVRYITNASSGLMGKALALESLAKGADVEFITGPVNKENIPQPNNKLNIHNVNTANEMLNKTTSLAEQADAVIFCAAVADYTIASYSNEKIPGKQEELSINLKPNPDIAALTAAGKKPGQIMIGFALESNEDKAAENAMNKLKNKSLDALMLNSPQSLNADSADFTFIRKSSGNLDIEKLGKVNKSFAAEHIVNYIKACLSDKDLAL